MPTFPYRINVNDQKNESLSYTTTTTSTNQAPHPHLPKQKVLKKNIHPNTAPTNQAAGEKK